MKEYLTFALTVFTGFFAIMNPIANTPVFLGLVDGEDEASRRRIAKKSTITAFIIVFIFVILGKYIFEIFSITIPAFKITGGILVFYVGFEMLMSRKSKVHGTDSGADIDSVAISPLAIPILAGPGTIVTAINFASGANLIHIAIVTAIFGIMVWLTYTAFRLGEAIVQKLGQNIISVIGKIMGLIIGIIGTGMVTEGIKLSFGLK